MSGFLTLDAKTQLMKNQVSSFDTVRFKINAAAFIKIKPEKGFLILDTKTQLIKNQVPY